MSSIFSLYSTASGVVMQCAARICNWLRKCDGSITVEFVALTPVLLVALVFSFEFGRALWAYDVMTRDLRAASRFLSRDFGALSDSNKTQAENVAQTGSPSGTTKHFPWNECNECFSFVPVRSYTDGEFNKDVTVYRISASVPLTLSFLEFFNSVLGSDSIPTSYTLVVADEVRWIGE